MKAVRFKASKAYPEIFIYNTEEEARGTLAQVKARSDIRWWEYWSEVSTLGGVTLETLAEHWARDEQEYLETRA